MSELIKYEPRPYQAAMTQKIIDCPACALMLDMGMGKTVTTLMAIADLMYDRFAVRKVLIVAPLRVAQTTWGDEAAKWEQTSFLRVSVCVGSRAARLKALAAEADIYTINRENIPWLVEHYGRKWPFDMVVIDESSSFKNPAAKRFRALKRVRPLIRRIVELTGTPQPRGLMDLWSQVYLLDMGKRLGKTIGAYRRTYFSPGAHSGQVVYEWALQPGASDTIYGLIDDICVSLKSEDYIDLPPVIYNDVVCELPPAAKATYDKLERDMVVELAKGDSLTAGSVAILTGKLLQMANGAVYNEEGETVALHDAKLEALDEIIECNEGKNIMVFYYFKHDLQRLLTRYPRARKLDKVADIRDWNAGKIPLLLVHPASAGHGLNLQQGGSIAVWYSLTWALELYQQANKRLHRPGQEHTVVIHRIIAKGTKDEDVIKALELKGAGQDYLLETIKAKIDNYRRQ